MATIRVRVELQRSGKGIEMSKLAELSKEAQKLFRMVAVDVGLREDNGTWVALDFYNQGIGFDAEYQLAEVDHQEAATYIHAVSLLAAPEPSWKVPGVKSETLVQCARLATLADIGETVRFGLLNESNVVVEWRPLLKDRAAIILEHFESMIEYRGMLQGIIHSLFKESAPPAFVLRDFASRSLVKCFFESQDYPKVHRSLERKESVVLVSGWVRAKRLDRSIESMRVERVEPTKPLNEAELREFFGSAPGWTGDLTPDEFIARLRDEADGAE